MKTVKVINSLFTLNAMKFLQEVSNLILSLVTSLEPENINYSF